MQNSQHKQRFPAKITQWKCPNCGQLLFTSTDLALPIKCAMCRQRIEWEEQGNHVRRWRCPNCGQISFTAPDDKPPDICAFCLDFTTWKRVYD